MINHVAELKERETSPAARRAPRLRIAVVIPCFNEELTIAQVVREFRHELPAAKIYVFDNNSTDRTAQLAREAGATVIMERRQGKGFVIQSMFRRIDADVYITVDGDGQLPSATVHTLLAPILNDEADMVVGSRLTPQSRAEFKRVNRIGNRLILAILNLFFRIRLTDILSGYRAFNRRFIKSIPLFGGGFEIETELTIKAIVRGYRIVEVPIDMGQRPPGSVSKVNLWRDGLTILYTILALFRDYQPLTFFGLSGLGLILTGVVLGFIMLAGIPKSFSPSPLFVGTIVIIPIFIGSLSLAVGLILHSIARRSQEFEHQLQVLAADVERREAEPFERNSLT